MISIIAKGLLIPFMGWELHLVPAAVWSLLIPSMNQAVELGMGKVNRRKICFL